MRAPVGEYMIPRVRSLAACLVWSGLVCLPPSWTGLYARFMQSRCTTVPIPARRLTRHERPAHRTSSAPQAQSCSPPCRMICHTNGPTYDSGTAGVGTALYTHTHRENYFQPAPRSASASSSPCNESPPSALLTPTQSTGVQAAQGILTARSTE